MVKRVIDRLFDPVDIASLVVFRVCFGLILANKAYEFFSHGWIRSYYIRPKLHFKYYGFGWVEAWPGNGMYWHFLVFGIASLCIALGFLYRIATVVFFLSFTYIFLLDQARYLNHFYLVSLFGFVMMFMPLNRSFSLDALIWKKRRSETIAAWNIWLMRALLTIVYSYAAVAKMNGDWLRGEPMRMWLAKRTDYDLFGGFIPVGELFGTEMAVWFFSYGGLCFDLLIGPALLWRRTRPFAFVFVLFFHLTNRWLFDIGIFPIMMIPITALFFESDWPRRILNWPRKTDDPAPGALAPKTAWGRKLIVGGLASFLAFQILVPLRHFLYPGTVHWTEEGHRFAWHMKLRNKTSRVKVTVRDPDSGNQRTINLREYLTSRQIRKVGGRPDMALQFAHYIAEDYSQRGYPNVEVYADIKAALNGRRYVPIIDPNVNLAAQKRDLRHADWIVPLTEPLKRPEDAEEEPEPD